MLLSTDQKANQTARSISKTHPILKLIKSEDDESLEKSSQLIIESLAIKTSRNEYFLMKPRTYNMLRRDQEEAYPPDT